MVEPVVAATAPRGNCRGGGHEISRPSSDGWSLLRWEPGGTYGTFLRKRCRLCRVRVAVDWDVYWFMLPVCVVVASVAMFSGISGAALLIPVFLIGFPLLGVPRLTTVEAVATALFLETSGFGTGVARYARMRLADLQTVRSLLLVAVPLGALGAVASAIAPVQVLRLGYGTVMIALAYVIAQGSEHGSADDDEGVAPAVVRESGAAHRPCPEGERRDIVSSAAKRYVFCAHGLRGQRVLSGVGALAAGMISTGVGEATLPGLVRRSHFPVAVAAATSTMVVAGTVVGATATHLVQLAADGGLSAAPWNLIVWAVPGAVAGAALGTRLQGHVSERASRMFFASLFAVIGLTFLVAFTLFRSRFG